MRFSKLCVLALTYCGFLQDPFLPFVLAANRRRRSNRKRDFAKRGDGDADSLSSSSQGGERKLQLKETRIKTVVGGNDIVFTQGIVDQPRDTVGPSGPSGDPDVCTERLGDFPCPIGRFCAFGASINNSSPVQCRGCPVPPTNCDELAASAAAANRDRVRIDCLLCFADVIDFGPSPIDLDLLNSIIGSVFYQNGGAYGTTSVSQRRRDAPGVLKYPKNPLNFNTQQPVKFPGRKEYFFITGECTTTASSGTLILQRSCFYTLCLGGGGFNCVNFFCGGPFRFDPFKTVEDPSNPGQFYPELPPKFSGFVLGGTGSFSGIKGTVSVLTQTGRTTPLNGEQFGLITQIFTFNTLPKIPEPPGPALALSSVADEAGQRVASFPPTKEPTVSPTKSPTTSSSTSPSTSPSTSESTSPSTSPSTSESTSPSTSPSTSESTSPTTSTSTSPTLELSLKPSTVPCIEESNACGKSRGDILECCDGLTCLFESGDFACAKETAS